MVASRLYSRMTVSPRLACLGLIGLQVIFLSGCKKPEEIRTYTVAHREVPKLVIMRMLGAIIPHDKEAWFFKVTGLDADITGLEPEFVKFTKSVQIKSGKVTWKAPDTWKELPGGEFRFATFLIPHGAEKPFELAISRLDAPEGVNNKYLQANLTRWRGQLALGPVELDDIKKIRTVEFDGGSAWVVNYAGLPSPSAAMTPPPFANAAPAGHPPIDAGPAEEPSTEPGAEKFQFETPKGWSPGKPNSMRKASLVVVADDATADISVFQLPAAANELLPNVNRWRDQVKLKEVSAEELQKTAKKIEVGGETGDYVELIGEKETLLGVMVKKGESAWFFKLLAPTALAAREKSKFEEFVKSWKLP